MPDLQTVVDELRRSGLLAIGGQLLLILIATLLALRFAQVTIDAALARLFQREVDEGSAQNVSAIELRRRRDTLDGLVNRSLRVIILIIAFLMALQVLRLDIGPAIAGLGLVGLALSLGAQHLVRDYVAGAFVLIENQYSKGDIVQIAGVTGSVEDVSLRRTTLRDFDGTVHFVPHGLIQVASNLTRTWAGIDIDVPVPYEESLSAVIAAIDRAATALEEDPEWRGRVLEKPRVVRVERLAEQGITLKVFGRVAAVHRFSAAGRLRGLIVEQCEREGLVLGWRVVPPRDQASDGRTTDRAPTQPPLDNAPPAKDPEIATDTGALAADARGEI